LTGSILIPLPIQSIGQHELPGKTGGSTYSTERYSKRMADSLYHGHGSPLHWWSAGPSYCSL